MKKTIVLAIALAGFLSFGLGHAEARDWNPSPEAAARDYVIVQHDIANGELVMLIWAAPQLVPANTQGSKEARRVLDEYVSVGLVHARVDQNGLFESQQRVPATLKLYNGTVLPGLPVQEIPPLPGAVLTAFQQVFSQNLGALGQMMTWYTVDGGAISACEKGGFLVSYNGVDYNFDTPIPGC